MHELSIAQSLIDVVKEEMRKNNAKSLRSVRLHVGEMTAVVPEALAFSFEVVTNGTELEGTRLLMDVIPLRGYCPGCNEEFEIKDFTFICPSCESTKIETIAGRELSIVEIEVA